MKRTADRRRCTFPETERTKGWVTWQMPGSLRQQGSEAVGQQQRVWSRQGKGRREQRSKWLERKLGEGEDKQKTGKAKQRTNGAIKSLNDEGKCDDHFWKNCQQLNFGLHGFILGNYECFLPPVWVFFFTNNSYSLPHLLRKTHSNLHRSLFFFLVESIIDIN